MVDDLLADGPMNLAKVCDIIEQIAPGTNRPDLELLQPIMQSPEIDTSLSE